MDLGAYAQIKDLKSIMTENGIFVPRLRGIRLMSAENPIPAKEIEEEARNIGLYRCVEACESNFEYNPACWTICSQTDRIKRKYLVFDNYVPVDIRWDRIHGKKRKVFKYFLKKARKKVYDNFLTFNKYCGWEDILYIHARIGGGNWPEYRKEIETQPWFICKIDDPFDSTYCDIYARINAGKGDWNA